MGFPDENIIQKQVIDIIVNAPVDGFEFQNEVDSLCRIELKKGLENLLEKYNSLDEVIRIDVLFAEVDYSSLKDFESSFAEKILKEVEKALSKQVFHLSKSTNDTTLTVANKLVRLLVFYLQKGFLPWWSTVKTSEHWNELVNSLFYGENKNADWTLLYPILKEKSARLRVFEVFSPKQFWIFSEAIAQVNISSIQADFEIIRAFAKSAKEKLHFEHVFKDVLLKAIAEAKGGKMIELFSEMFITQVKSEQPQLFSLIVPQKISTPELEGLFRKEISKAEEKRSEVVAKKPIIPDVTKIEDNQSPNSSKQYGDIEKEEIYINNAGLIITAAYLPMFFKDIRLISEEGVLDTSKAIAIMQYIIKGTDGYEEFETVLPKILCGLNLNEPIKIKKVSQKEKKKVNELLESVLEHWAVLKSTSVEGLRVSFLQREGRLVFTNNEWNLKVEQEAYDMLLSHLPWNISIIKLPWMNYLLNVEWA